MSASPEDLKENVRNRALALGFSALRVARAGEAGHALEFQQWIDAEHYGDMGWMARNHHRRKDPREVLPGARSVLVVALNYFQTPPTVPGSQGKIALYAWGDDYHDVMDPRLRALCAELEAMGGTQKLYVDTGPVLERDWATSSGLGWNGKSTMQIHPALGTYFFLGEILTTLDFPPDPPMPDRCGKCVRCITACPTAAITGPHKLDARRCISYLTIEHKGSIPVEFRRAIGNRLYGCDDCLEACPWNRFAQASRETAFAARSFVHHIPLRDFLKLTEDEFRELFRGSPIKRIKRPAFLRNVCVVLGNVGDAADLPALRAAASDPHPLITEHAQWAMAEIAGRGISS